MAKLSWLENLQKSAPLPAAQSRLAVDALLAAGPFDTTHDDPPILAGRTSTVYDNGAADVADPVSPLINRDLLLSKNWGDITLSKSIEVVLVGGQKQVHYFDQQNALCAVRVLARLDQREVVSDAASLNKILGVEDMCPEESLQK